MGQSRLLGVMRGNAYPALVSKDYPCTLRREVILPEVHSVEARRQAEICPVIHKQGDFSPEHTPQFSRMRQHLSRRHLLGSILKESDSSRGKFSGEVAYSGGEFLGRNSGCQEPGIDDGVQTRQAQRSLVHACPIYFPAFDSAAFARNRSMNLVSKLPERKSGSRMMR